MFHRQQGQISLKSNKALQKQQPLRYTTAPQVNGTHPATLIQRAKDDPSSLSSDDVLALQETMGNRAVSRLLAGRSATQVQAKLTIGEVGDKYEQEADWVAVEVVRQINAPAPLGKGQAVQRQTPEEKKEDELQMKPRVQRQPVGEMAATPDLEASVQHVKGSGQSLADNIQKATQVEVQRTLKNENVNNKELLQNLNIQNQVVSYAKKLDDAVQNAAKMIETKYFFHIPPADGYMQAFVDSWDEKTGKIKDNSLLPAKAGYWIESYATKVINPLAGGGLAAVQQSKRGATRPDIVLTYQDNDIAWLDITASNSADHIYSKNSHGWKKTPYVTEVVYDSIDFRLLNMMSPIPNKNVNDIQDILDRANKLKKEREDWEDKFLGHEAAEFRKALLQAYDKAKAEEINQVENEGRMDIDVEGKGNLRETAALTAAAEHVNEESIEAEDLAAFVLWWGATVRNYEKRNKQKIDKAYKPPSKDQLGLTWINDKSQGDGEEVMKKWFV